MESHLLPITSGVLQDSLLGPLIFLIFINDLIHSSKLLKFLKYAEDTSVLLLIDNLDTLFNHINQELILVTVWFYDNRLSINLAKTNYLLFTKSAADN